MAQILAWLKSENNSFELRLRGLSGFGSKGIGFELCCHDYADVLYCGRTPFLATAYCFDMPAPRPTRLFHITAIANVPRICEAGGLVSKNAGQAAGIRYQNIAHATVQNLRAGRVVPNPPGGWIHDFVPFYFAPRSPMLYAINSGRVAGCAWRQADIVHFETTVEAVVEAGLPYVFYDRNASLQYSVPYTTVAHLDSAVAWDLLTEPPVLDGFCQYWQNRADNPRYVARMEQRQAEFLAKNHVPLEVFTRVGVMNAQKQADVQSLLAAAGVNLRVDVKNDWYF